MGETPWGTPGSHGYHGPKCPKCGRVINKQWNYCAWCGTSKEDQEAFQKRSQAIKEGIARNRKMEKKEGV